jgi:hypothetical protein
MFSFKICTLLQIFHLLETDVTSMLKSSDRERLLYTNKIISNQMSGTEIYKGIRILSIRKLVYE